MSFKHKACILILAVLLYACQPQLESMDVETEAVHISHIIYSVRPMGGGFNSLEINANSQLIHRQASAQAPQVITQEESQIRQDEFDKIWKAAYRLWEDPPEGYFILPENGEGYTEVTILTHEQQQKSFFWRWDEVHEDEKVTALAELLAPHLPVSW